MGACPASLRDGAAGEPETGGDGAGELRVAQERPKDDGCALASLPNEVHSLLGLEFLGQPQPVACLACASTWLRARLSDSHGRLCVSSMHACRLSSAAGGLQHVRLQCLTALRVDLLAESAMLARRDVEGLISHLGECLSKGAALNALAIRLASFDASFERLLLGRKAWASLVRGLAALGRQQHLRSLEFSFVAIKLSQATLAVTSGEGDEAASEPTSLLQALGSLTSLEELSITHADLFGATVVALAEVLRELPRLRRVDITRNRISKKVLAQFREALPPKVQIVGEDSQTICCEDRPSGWRSISSSLQQARGLRQAA